MRVLISLITAMLFVFPSVSTGQGVAGWALDYDGRNTLAIVPGHDDFNCETVTIETWVNPDQCIAQDSWDSILNKPYVVHQYPHYQWLLTRRRDEAASIIFSINGEAVNVATDVGVMEIGEWNHLAATYDGEYIRIYVNGELNNEEEVRGAINAYDTNISFGQLGNVNVDKFNGIIDEIRVWNFARDPEDIQRTMNVSLTGNEEGLIGYWRFDEGEGQVITDHSGNEHHGRLGNNNGADAADPDWVESDAPIYGGVIDLSQSEMHYGPISSGREAVGIITITNVSEDDDPWHSVDFILTDEGGDPEWLAIDPVEGIVEVGQAVDISFTASTQDLEPGEYQRNVSLECNASNMQFLNIPVSMIVAEGAGRLSGIVFDPVGNHPVENAEIRAIGNYELVRTTDGNGVFEFADIPAFTYTFMVTAEDYLPLIVEEIEIQDGDDVQLELELMFSRLVPDPARIEASMQPDDELDERLRIYNHGNGPLTWSVEKVFPEGGEIEPWVYRWGFAAGDSVNDIRMAGIEFVNGRFYLAGGTDRIDQSMIYVFDRDGNYIDQFPQFAESRYGMRDLAWDGSLLWGVDGNTIYGFTTNGELQSELESPVNSARYIAYDPDRDALWVSSVTTSIEGITLDGEEIGALNRPPDTHIYGLGWFPEDEDGYYLYVFTNDGDYRRQVHKVNPATDESTFIRDLADIESGRAGGVAISGTWDPYCWVFMSMLDSPDMVAIWQLAPRTNWLDVAPIEGVVEPDGNVELTVTLNSLGLPVDEEFEADLVFTHDGVGSETTVPVSVLITDVGGVSQRIIQLDLGWNMVSSNVIPLEDSIEVIMRPLVEENLLLLMKDGDGHFYMPAFGYNDIPGWSVDEGYQVKVAEDCQFVIEGEVVAWNTPIELRDGWQIVSYYPRDPVDAMVALAGIEEQLLIAKDGWGHFYIPAFGFSDIGDMREGQGYQVKMDGDGELIYRLEDAPESYCPRYSLSEQTWLSEVQRTDVSYCLLLCGGETGERIEAYTPDGVLAGRGVFGLDGRCGLALWGDDFSTDAIEGFTTGEVPVIVRVNDGSSVEYAWLEGGSSGWTADGWGVAEVVTGSQPEAFGLYSAYPNPFNGSLRLEYSLHAAGDAWLSVYDVNGRLVDELVRGIRESGRHTVVWDASGISSGVYLVRLSSTGHEQTLKVLLLR